MSDIKLQGIDVDGIEKEYSLNDFKGQKVILYFYPKDNTSGCTRQTTVQKYFASFVVQFCASKGTKVQKSGRQSLY